jgi:hypothetical protein
MVPVGRWEGSTENATAVEALLADLVARSVDTKLRRILANPDSSAGLRDAKAPATALAHKLPGAASLREGMEDIFTVTASGSSATLADRSMAH